MECLEAKALKSSFHWELAMKSTQQENLEKEVWCFNGEIGDDFEVDEFFNFSNGDFEHGSGLQVEEEEDDDEEEEDDEEFEKEDGSLNSNHSGGFPAVDSDSLLSVEFAVPGEAMAELEWVSQFVDDSSSEFSLLCPAVKTETFVGNRSVPERRMTGTGISCLPLSFPVRPRTKRSRQSRKLNQSPSSSSSSTSSGISSPPYFIFPDTGENVDSVNAAIEPPKKQRKTLQHGGSAGSTQVQRRCSHCLVQKTPQWRRGPNGAKTLCNACGVRFKSGRLFPEYRPALSPTFCSDVHSNSHRKVLEMRKTKEISVPAPELTQTVPE